MVQRGATYERQERDWYRTPREPVDVLFKVVKFSKRICDPCCGDGALLKAFDDHGHDAFGSDIHPVGVPNAITSDFITQHFPWGVNCDIVTNPPYGERGALAVKFIERALEVTRAWGGKVAMLLPADFDSAKTRAHIFRDHPAFGLRIILLSRIRWFENGAGGSPSANHAWFCWDWHQSGFPIVRYGEW